MCLSTSYKVFRSIRRNLNLLIYSIYFLKTISFQSIKQHSGKYQNYYILIDKNYCEGENL